MPKHVIAIQISVSHSDSDFHSFLAFTFFFPSYLDENQIGDSLFDNISNTWKKFLNAQICIQYSKFIISQLSIKQKVIIIKIGEFFFSKIKWTHFGGP